MRDFSIKTYNILLDELMNAGYPFQTFNAFLNHPKKKVIILRHDVDDRKFHALEFAKIQKKKGILGTYFFRMVPQSFDEKVILEIAEMGHEIGYHYEDLDFANGDVDRAIELFRQNLEKLRELTPVSNICMHGSPRSKYDNRAIWDTYNYRDFGITGEPYFDIDYKNVFYLTDTGRRWDGHKVSIRDKVENHFGLSFPSTFKIIRSVKEKTFPDKVLFTFHPQRWTDSPPLWIREKWVQTFKNIAKYCLIKLNPGTT